MGLPFFVNCSFLIQRAIYFETAPFSYDIYVDCLVSTCEQNPAG